MSLVVNLHPQASPLSDDWRQWIAENLLLEVHPEVLVSTLVNQGFAPNLARQEVQAALASPYLTGARQGSVRLKNRLRKRDWVLGIYSQLNGMRPDALSIDRRHQLSRGDFFRHYYLNNRPVIISGMLNDWPALQRWNLGYFRERLGQREVEVQFGRDQDPQYEINSAQHKRTMRLADYLDLIEATASGNDFYMTANNSSHNKIALRELWDDIRPLTEYLNDTPGEGFFWLGPAGTRTPYHHDLTNNFMAQILGRKRVKLIPACDLPHLYNHRHCYTPVDGQQPDLQRFPALAKAQLLECVLEPGDLLFLPVGCWHYVEALDVSVTLSFTNFLLGNDFSSGYDCYGEL